MSRSTIGETLVTGTTVKEGRYECVACGAQIMLDQAGPLPTCEEDQGLHSIKAWRAITPVADHQTQPT